MEKIHPDLLAQMTALPPANRADAQPAESLMFRIVVTLDAPQGAEVGGANRLAQLQQRVRDAQDAVLGARQLGRFTLLNRYRNVFGFLARADEAAILELAGMGDVAFINTVPTMQKMDSQSHPLTGIDTVHASNFTGSGVTIAIIDDGIDAAHPAFGGDPAWPNAKIIAGYDFADLDSDPRIDCAQQSHGTAVAGVAAGNGGGVLGTAPDASLVFLKVQSAENCGESILDGDLLGALDWIVTNREQYGIDIVSMSLGGQAFNDVAICDNIFGPMWQIIDLAYTAGLVIFAASGNGGQIDAISHPACMSNIISVGAVYDNNIGSATFSTCRDGVTGSDRVTCYSNSAEFLDLLAPAHCAQTASPNGGLQGCFGGTSSATPFAAGVAAALMEASNTPLDNDGMRSLLSDTGPMIVDDKNGLPTPRIDASTALETLAPTSCPNCTLYTGTLSGTGDQDIQPLGTYYFSQFGTHSGWLEGPADVDFDLYLLKWDGSRWTTVAQSLQTGSAESVSYAGSTGFYAWVVFAYQGLGSYEFRLQRP